MLRVKTRKTSAPPLDPSVLPHATHNGVFIYKHTRRSPLRNIHDGIVNSPLRWTGTSRYVRPIKGTHLSPSDADARPGFINIFTPHDADRLRVGCNINESRESEPQGDSKALTWSRLGKTDRHEDESKDGFDQRSEDERDGCGVVLVLSEEIPRLCTV